ncbi:hypothetical protein AB0D04_26570 [Streptomyces sp. NPDC048483]|uniref:hypothetical protein n=1 Tax=Streptomyces sp. NPDC048483 TaxID=3154927 RepID=UPI00343DB4CD
MRSLRSPRLLSGTAFAAVAVALGLAASAAYAGDFGEVEASPHPARAGSSVSLATRDCGHSRSATVDASTLGGGIITLRPGKGALVGELRVRPDTLPGNYGIGGKCADGKDITGTVSAGRGDRGDLTGADRAAASPGPKPRGGVKTGAGVPDERPGTAEILTGACLMLAAAAGGSWVLRRRHGGGRG